MKKVVVCCLAACMLGAGLFAQDSDYSDDFDEFAALFEDAEDIEVESGVDSEEMFQNADADGSHPVQIIQQVFSNGNIRFSGSTEAKLGAGVYIYPGKDTFRQAVDPFPAYTLSSTLNFSARVDDTAGVYGSFSAAFPGNLQFSCSSLYFDYLLLDRIYLSAGHKATSWGNTRIFSGANSFIKDDDETSETARDTIEALQNAGFLYTNVIYDSGYGVSAYFRYPTNRGEIAFIGYYPAWSNPSLGQVCFAGLWDTCIGHTNINFFGRSYGYASGTAPVFGTEQKRTIWGFDVYAQEALRFDFNHKMVTTVVTTAGFYRLWDAHVPHVGLNVEFQDAWNPVQKKHNFRLGFDGGLKRLGKKRNQKIGISASHNFLDKAGEVTLAHAASGILPHADWTTGITAEYHTDGTIFHTIIAKITAATTLSLSLSY